jgi:hypothetical protein
MTTEDGTRRAVAAWLEAALADARRRGLPELQPLLESLADSTRALRMAAWNDEVRVPEGVDAECNGRVGRSGNPPDGAAR